MTIRLPPDSTSTNSVMTWPMPVRVTVPTMMPAAAVATPMPIMFRAPAIMPSIISTQPSLNAAEASPVLRNIALSGRWVIRITSISALAQNADRPGDFRSIIRNQTSTTMGRI